MRARTPSFIAEFPLSVTSADDAELCIRLDAARNIYNACLGESLRRLKLMRESRTWRAARAMPKGKARTEAFRAAQMGFGFMGAAIQKFAERCRDACWIGDRIGSHDTQTTSLRAFQAVQRHAFGGWGRPRFKGKRRLHSIEGKGDAVIRFQADPVPAIHYSGLVLLLKLDPRDRDGWQAEALRCRTKFVRIIRRRVNGMDRWFTQLVQEGIAPVKRPVGEGVVGLDIGPSTIAAVSGDDAMLETFCPAVEDFAAEARRVQRAMDRSRRATNPDAFNADGTYRKGARIAVRSRRYRILRDRLADTERRLAAERKRSHGELANRVLCQGNAIKTEKISYRSFQKNFGKSVKRRAPSMFVSTLKRKAEGAGAKVIEFSTRTTRLSQFSHDTGEYVKKPLSQRVHVFADGTKVQRDLYSAWLARFVEDGKLNVTPLSDEWPGAEPLLNRAALGFKQSAIGLGFALPGVLRGVGVDRPVKCDARVVQAMEV